MQKNRKILLSVAICLSLVLAATHISHNGGLQSSILAPLNSCKNSRITSLERCKPTLTAEKTRIQKEMTALDKKIAAKKTECIKLMGAPNRSTQLSTCRAQLKVLERDQVKQVAAMKPIDLAISKLVSEAPLQAKVLSSQKELDTIKAQATTKVGECNTLRAQKKTAQAATCNQQLIVLRQTQKTVQTALINATNTLKKVAGVTTPLVAPSPTPPVTPAKPIVIPVPTPVPVIPVPVVPITPVTPAPIPAMVDCCPDPSASNGDAACIAPLGNPNPAMCTYHTGLVCEDPNSPSYRQAGPCQPSAGHQGCTDPTANNRDLAAVVDDGSCTYDPIPACNGAGDHGYDPATRTCETCSDGKKNGDEKNVDCGGKCGACNLRCDDQAANNYDADPAKEVDNNTCLYNDETSNIEPLTPLPYCDVPGALNYESHSKDDPAYQASASACNFCGNDRREGVILSNGIAQPETLTGDTGTTIQVAEECEDGKDDKQYDGCYQCRLETCGDELALCREYKFTGGEEEGSLSSKLSSGLKDKPASKRPEWNNHHVDVVKTKDRDFATFGATCIRNKEKKFVSYTGYRTVWGLNVDGSIDQGDNGLGSPDYGNLCWGCAVANLNSFFNNLPTADKNNPTNITTGPNGSVMTRNKIIRGVAVPKEMLREIFSTDVNYRKVRVEVTGPNGCFRYPVVDEGPHEFTWARKCSAILDLTYAAAAELGLLDGNNNPQIKWNIIENAGEDFRERITNYEIAAGFNTMTYGNDYYGYRGGKNGSTKGTLIDYPQEYFIPTRC